MEQKLVRIRELINEKEAIDTELASLLGGTESKRKPGRPRKSGATAQGSRERKAEAQDEKRADEVP